MHVMYHLYILLLLCATLPLQAVIAALTILTSGRPVFFTQERVGKNGKPFLLYKFRTMRTDAGDRKRQLLRQNEADGPVFKIKNDPRYTRFGRFLSHTGLDELPQLYNVFCGDMALIGPRPLPVSEARKLAPWMKKREDLLPGIISPAILGGKYHQNFRAWMKSDIRYVQTKNIIYDSRLTVAAVRFLFVIFWRETLHSLRSIFRER